MTGPHILVAGPVENSIALVRALRNQNVNLSFLPQMPSELAQDEQAKAQLVEEHIKDVKSKSLLLLSKRSGKGLFRSGSSGSEDSFESVVRNSEIEEALDILSEVDSEEAVVAKLVGEATEEEGEFYGSIQVVKSFNDINNSITNNGKLAGVMLTFGYIKLLSANGAVFLGNLVKSLKPFEEGMKPFLCFPGPLAKLSERLSRFDLENIEVCVAHPLFQPRMLPELKSLTVIPALGFSPAFKQSLDFFLSQGLQVYTVDEAPIYSISNEIKHNALKRILADTSICQSAAGLMPLLYVLKCQWCLNSYETKLSSSSDRVQLAFNSKREILGDGIKSAFFSTKQADMKELETYLELYHKKDDFCSGSVLDELKDERYVLSEMANENTPQLNEILNQTEMVNSVPRALLPDAKRDEYNRLLSIHTANKYH